MAEVTSLVLAVDSRQVSGAAVDLERMARSGAKAETATDSLQRSYAATNRAASLLRSTLGGLSAALVLRQVIQTADAYANLTSRLKLATEGTGSFLRAQTETLAIAQRTSQGLGDVADLYGSLARSTRGLGASQGDVLKVTEGIGQALRISGASAQAASAAVTQLGQGLASGTLRGEELNSILEQTPRLAQAIADGLGVSVGKLRELGQAGQLTSERVFSALLTQSQRLKQEFETLPTTVSGALQQVGNSFSVLIGSINQATGATTTLAAGLSRVASAIDAARIGSNPKTLPDSIRVLEIEREAIERNLKAYQLRGQVLSNTSPEKQRIAEIDRLIAAYRRESDEIENENRRLLNRVNSLKPSAATVATSTATAAKTGGSTIRASGADPYAAEVKSLRERIALLGQDTALEQVNAQIKLGNFGKLSTAQQEALRGLALQLDAGRESIDLARAEAEARESATQALTRASQQQLTALDGLRQGNAALADEIELIGADVAAQGAIEQARVRSIRTLKEEQLARLEATGVADQQLQLLRAEIELLRQRESLLGRRTDKQLAEAAKSAAQAAREGYDAARDLGLAFSSAFEDAIVSGKGLREVLFGLEQDLLRILTRKLVTEPLANAITGIFTGGGGGAIFGGGPAAPAFGGAQASAAQTAQTAVQTAAQTAAVTAQTTALTAQTAATVAATAAQTADTAATVARTSAEVAATAAITAAAASSAAALAAMSSAALSATAALTALAASPGGGGGGSGDLLGTIVGALISSGGRAIGGPVSAGNLYRINERGPGEILNVGARQYLLPGQNGEVEPKQAAQAPSMSVVNNFAITGPADRRTQDQIARRAGIAIQDAMARGTA